MEMTHISEGKCLRKTSNFGDFFFRNQEEVKPVKERYSDGEKFKRRKM